MSHANDRRRSGEPIALLQADHVKDLVEWVPSHQRKFAEAAAQFTVEGWQNVFSKAHAFDALAKLLRMPNGLVDAEAICARAGIRGVRECAERRARSALPASAARSETSRWPSLLSQEGKAREAAWWIWIQPPTEYDEQDLRDPEVAALLEPSAGGHPGALVTRTLEDLVAELAAELSRRPANDAALPGLMRSAADALEVVRAAATERSKLISRRSDLLHDLEEEGVRLASCGSDNTLAAAELLRELATRAAAADLGELAGWVSAARAHREAAETWRRLFDTLPDTHDYAGIAEAHAIEAAKWSELACLAGGPGKAEAGTGPEGAVGTGQPSLPTRRVPYDGTPRPDPAPSPPEPAEQPRDASDTWTSERPCEAGEGTIQTPDSGGGEWELVAGSSGADGDAERTSRPLAEAACARALAEGRYGLAAKVMAVAAAGGLAPPLGFSTTLLETLVLGLAVGEPGCEGAVDAFAARRDKLVEELAGSAERSVQLIAFAGALRPALFAIVAGAESVLRLTTNLRSVGDGLAGLATHAAEVARRGEIAPAELVEIRDRLTPARELGQHRIDTARFLEQARRKTIKFQRATVVWTDTLRTGPVHEALRAIVDGAADAAARVSVALEGQLADISRFVADADRAATNNRKAQPLTAGARSTLVDWIGDVADRLRRWQALNEAATAPEPNRYKLETRQELRRLLEDARPELAALTGGGAGSGDEPAARATALAAAVADDAIASVLRLFETTPLPRLSLDMRLNDDVLLLPSVWRPDRADAWTTERCNSFFAEVKGLAGSNPDFGHAFERALAGGHFHQASQALDRLRIEDADGSQAIEARLRGELDHRTQTARSKLSRIRKRLHDLLGADDRQILNRDLEPELDKLQDVLHPGEPLVDFSDWELRAGEIEEELDRAFGRLLGPLHARLGALEAAGREVGDLRKMEELKDLTTLAEHIEAYEKGAPPPEPPADLLEAFGRHLLANVDRRADLSGFQRAATRREAWGGVDFSTFDEGQVDAASSLLDAWRALKQNSERDSAVQVERLFGSLLSSQVDVQKAKGTGVSGHYMLRTPTYADREECVAPAFGSAAQGRYDVILVEMQNIGSGAELAALKGRVTAPTFFVIRGQMAAAARSAFMIHMRRRGSSPACGLIDEALVLFLATRQTRRRSDLFGLALAMGVVQPYSDAAQQTSPEMFFGRTQELDQIWDPNGSCLVYGGRQLGKTALLRQIELRHGSATQIVVYGDQMAEGFGDGRFFWAWIGKAVHGRGVPIPPRAAAEAVRDSIRKWLEGDRTRRLLFLIDEADAFLRDNIRRDFKVLVEVRELMRVTDRRCKFVFAGLHDVQRLARTPNSPLLHFGNPIRVGPLMGEDLFSARSMVEQPMAAAGYAFGASSEEGRALVGRALSEVGYYPSLMQTFGMVLINRLNGRAPSRIKNPPTLPIRISESELDEALDDNSFRDSVRTKFDNTLNLDPRYRLIAYLILLGTQEAAARDDLRPGMSVAEIQRDAIYWWPQGFAEDASNSAFEGLLKEMEGLGALVGLSDGRYAIRSARIAAMLGTLREVEDRVQELAGQPYRVDQDTGSSRRLVAGAPSPLTFRQEGVLLEVRRAPAVTVALSSQALGLGALAKAVEDLARSDETMLAVTMKASSVGELERAISSAAERAKAARRGRGLLIAEGPWLGREAVDAAFAHAEVRRAQRASTQGVRIILIPRMIDWSEVPLDVTSADRLWDSAVLTLRPLQQGGLAEWLERRTSARPVPGDGERLRLSTGGFPHFLGSLKGKTNEDLITAAEAASEAYARDPRAALIDLGLGDQKLLAIARFVRDQGGRVNAEDREALITLMEEAHLRTPDLGLDALEHLAILDRTLDDDPPGSTLNPLVARLI